MGREKCPWYEEKCILNPDIPIEVDKDRCEGKGESWVYCLRAQVDPSRTSKVKIPLEYFIER